MHTNPRLRLPYDPHTGEVWKYYGVIKVIPIVMDKMLVILMTILVLEKTLKVHGLFKSICRSGANLEKVLRIPGGAMQVYHQNQ